MMTKEENLRDQIRKRYAKIAAKGNSCGCGCSGIPHDINHLASTVGYTEEDATSVPQEANLGLGCGNPVAIASLHEGEAVLDLGCGGGFDCFLARSRVGEKGYVIGVDMTPEMIELARRNLKKSSYSNMDFRLGEIEHLPVTNESIDIIISNCVVNLSTEKEQVFKEAYRVLKTGGRLAISDVVATAELPEKFKNDLKMRVGCIAGAEYLENIKIMLENAGFTKIQMVPKDNSKEIIRTWLPDKGLEEFIASYIIEAIK
jgi:ubiquinone/menaquinone biosynthesis C-methylase UbiE